MTKASLCHITVQQMRLRWLETSEAHSSPLLSFKLFGTECDTHTHTPVLERRGGGELDVGHDLTVD